MKCGDVMSRNLEWLTEEDTVLKAATVMAESGVGFLPICDDRQRVIGVVTDRDLATRGITQRFAPETTPATTAMTTPAVTCLPSTDIRDAEELMASERKTRLVVTDAAGHLVGVLSLADLIERAPTRASLETVRAVMWRDALGPRAGAPKGQPLLKDDPIAQNQPLSSGDAVVHPTVFTGGHREIDTKEFPG